MHREVSLARFRKLLALSVLPTVAAIAGCTATARFDLSNHRPEAQQGSPHGTTEAGGEPGRRASLGWTARRAAQGSSFDHDVVVVREGETLHSIARRYDAPVSIIMRANGLAGDHIVPGQQILVPIRPGGP